jgi:hypothetical protein|tara:strand:+ start:169 stop:801 length:633 start_codon:yes stop_codon:yes gene_type:complete
MAAAMETAGSPPSDGHKTLEEYITEGDIPAGVGPGPIPSDIFKWCFVRNPYDRLFSAYLYHHGITLCDGTVPGRVVFSELDSRMSFFMSSFENYILNLKELKKLNIKHLKEQHSFISSENVTMDFIGRYETIEQDWNYISNKLYNQKLHLDIINHSTAHAKALYGNRLFSRIYPGNSMPKNYISLYTPEMIKVVNEVYSKDFELFGYTRY